MSATDELSTTDEAVAFVYLFARDAKYIKKKKKKKTKKMRSVGVSVQEISSVLDT
jgi:hypothetical protein